MSAEVIFREYDRAALDTQYNNSAAVPEHVEHSARWTHDGAAALGEFAHQLDIGYGPSSAETLDVFPGKSGAPAPVQVFFHGGYWMSRDKDEFRFLARAFVPAGAALVLVNYALIPTVDMDELVRQCRAALAWVYRNASSFNGDPNRIFISGHSAGGHLVAMMMATDWPAFAEVPQDVVKGGCAVSGVYDLAPIPLCYLNHTLHLSAGEVERNNPIQLKSRSTAPLILAYGGLESAEFHRQSREFADAWNPQGVSCQIIECPGMNHFTILDDFLDRGSLLGQAVMAQMGLA
ncbi:MAG: alpha/beta hydrolase [Acidiferrobacterales bacterium]